MTVHQTNVLLHKGPSRTTIIIRLDEMVEEINSHRRKKKKKTREHVRGRRRQKGAVNQGDGKNVRVSN